MQIEKETKKKGRWAKECHEDCAHNMRSGIRGTKMDRNLCTLDAIILDDEDNCLSYQTEIEYALECACIGLLKALRNNKAGGESRLLINVETGDAKLYWSTIEDIEELKKIEKEIEENKREIQRLKQEQTEDLKELT